MSSEVTIYEKLSGLEAIHAIGEIFTRSGMFGAEKTEQGKVLALACLTERMSPFKLLQKHHMVKGRLTLRADYTLAEFKRIGGKCQWISKMNDAKKAEAHFVFQENDLTEAYTIDDAKREGLADRDNWKKSTPDMLRSRLVTKVCRMIAPGIVAGMNDESDGDADISEAAGVDFAKSAASALAAKPGESVITVEAEPIPQQTAPEPSLGECQSPPAAVIAEEIKAVDKAAAETETAQASKVQALERVFGESEKAVNHFLRKKNWITKDQTFRDVSDQIAVTITGRHKDFVKKAVETYGADNPAK
jgi:hypothetical protein